MKNIISVLLCFGILLQSHWLLADDDIIPPNQHPLRIVSSLNNAPFSFVLPDGTKTGLYVEFWNLWSETNNIPIEIVMTRLKDGLLLVKDKNAIHSGLFSNDERAKWADFSIPIHKVNTSVLYSRSIDKAIKLKQQTEILVAAHYGSFQANFVKNNLPHLKLKTDVENDLVFNQLLDEEVQALVAEVPFLNSQLASRGLNGVLTVSDEILISNLVHAVIAKGQPELLNVINAGIENIPIKSLIKLEKKWLPNSKPYFKDFDTLDILTLSEQTWLLEHPNLTLGTDTEWYPFDFVNKNGDFSGIISHTHTLLPQLL